MKNRKKYFITLGLFLRNGGFTMLIKCLGFLFCFISIFSDIPHLKVASSSNLCKIEVDPQAIFFHSDGMEFFLTQKRSIRFQDLYFEKGKYIAKIERGIIEDILGVWYCYNCQNWNSRFDDFCMYCGEPR